RPDSPGRRRIEDGQVTRRTAPITVLVCRGNQVAQAQWQAHRQCGWLLARPSPEPDRRLITSTKHNHAGAKAPAWLQTPFSILCFAASLFLFSSVSLSSVPYCLF